MRGQLLQQEMENRRMSDCENCKYYHNNCDARLRCRIDVEQIRTDAIKSAYYVIKPFMSLEEWTEEVNRQIELKEQTE